MNEDGDYVILSVEKDEVYDHSSYRQFCQHVTDQDSMAQSDPGMKACRSLMILAPEYTKFDVFAQNVTLKTFQEPFKVPRYHGRGDVNIQVPIYAGLAHDAVILLAEGMTRVMRATPMHETDPDFVPLDPRSGSQVVAELKNLQYKSRSTFCSLSSLGLLNSQPHSLSISLSGILGGDALQKLDENGDAGGSYTLLSFQSHMNASMRPVAKFNLRNCSGKESHKCAVSSSFFLRIRRKSQHVMNA